MLIRHMPRPTFMGHKLIGAEGKWVGLAPGRIAFPTFYTCSSLVSSGPGLGKSWKHTYKKHCCQ